ncbi:hypothetical protein ACWFNE_00150 [Cellulomonas sp. NPDC055163]
MTATRARRTLTATLAVLALVAASLLVWRSTYASFSATTANPNNQWSAGTVTLTDNRSSTALWTSAAGLKPGSTGTSCIRVDYTGSLAARVRMYVAPGALTGTGLGTYLRFTVDEGTVGDNATCADFGGTVTRLHNSGAPGTGTTAADGSDSAATLATFAGARTSFASGASTWAPVGTGEKRTYRITWTVLDDNLAAGKNATATFTWEAQNS